MQHLFPRTGIVPAASPYFPIEADCNLYHDYVLGDAKDHSIYGNDGTVVGGTFGEFGLTYDGIDNIVTVPYDASLVIGTGDFTFLFWMKPTSAGLARVMASLWNPGDAFYQINQSGGNLNCAINVCGVDAYYDIAGDFADLQDGEFHCFAYRIDRDHDGTEALYYDKGVFGLPTGYKNTTNSLALGNAPLGIGGYPADPTNAPYKGIIGATLFFNKWKTTNELDDIYNFLKAR